MIDRTLMAGLALTLALAATTPGSAVAQAATEERYKLVEVGGSALPVEVEKGIRCREYVTAATLTLRPDSVWTLEYDKREVCGGREERETEHEDGRYSVTGDNIRFYDDDDDDDDDDDRDDIDMDDLATATRSADGRLTAKLEDGKTVLVFRR